MKMKLRFDLPRRAIFALFMILAGLGLAVVGALAYLYYTATGQIKRFKVAGFRPWRYTGKANFSGYTADRKGIGKGVIEVQTVENVWNHFCKNQAWIWDLLRGFWRMYVDIFRGVVRNGDPILGEKRPTPTAAARN